MRNTSSLLALVAQGLGVTLLPELLLRSDSSKRLRFLTLEDNRIIRSVSVITAPSASLSHATYSFLKALKSCKPAWAEDQP